MLRHTVLPFKLERTDETLTAHGGLALLAEYTRALDLRELTREDALLALLGHAALPDPDTVGDWLRRMGDPQTGQAGLEGLGQVRDALTGRLVPVTPDRPCCGSWSRPPRSRSSAASAGSAGRCAGGPDGARERVSPRRDPCPSLVMPVTGSQNPR